MDIITSIGPAVFALTIFLISVAATIAASVISKQVLEQQAEVQYGSARKNDNIAPVRKVEDQDDTREEDGARKAA